MNPLTEQQLREKIAQSFPFNTFGGETLNQLVEATVAIVTQERKAWGEHVIGEDRSFSNKDPKWYQKCVEYINRTKAIQRQRNQEEGK